MALADCRQYTLAAGRCHISQSALSQLIARLEEQAGVRLFDRSTRSVSLTPEGELLVPVARRLLSDIQVATEDLQDHARGHRGRVAIAALASHSDEWLPRVIAMFRQRYPGIRVQLFDVISEQGMDLLRRGTVDFALSSSAMIPDEFEVQQLLSERFFLVCPPDHALARRKRLTIASLAGCQYIHSSKTGSVWPYLIERAPGLRLVDSGFEVMQFGTIAGLIENGLGVTVIPEFSLHQFTRRGLKAVLIGDKGFTRPLRMLRRRGHDLSIAAQAMLREMKANPPAQLHTASVSV